VIDLAAQITQCRRPGSQDSETSQRFTGVFAPTCVDGLKNEEMG
jgi:hypothetical protein